MTKRLLEFSPHLHDTLLDLPREILTLILTYVLLLPSPGSHDASALGDAVFAWNCVSQPARALLVALDIFTQIFEFRFFFFFYSELCDSARAPELSPQRITVLKPHCLQLCASRRSNHFTDFPLGNLAGQLHTLLLANLCWKQADSDLGLAVAQLTNLVRLDLDWCYIHSEAPTSASVGFAPYLAPLTNLEELRITDETGDVGDYTQFLPRMTKLRCLDIYTKRDSTVTLRDVTHLVNLELLTLNLAEIADEPWPTSLTNLTALCIEWCDHDDADHLVEPNLPQVPASVTLFLDGDRPEQPRRDISSGYYWARDDRRVAVDDSESDDFTDSESESTSQDPHEASARSILLL